MTPVHILAIDLAKLSFAREWSAAADGFSGGKSSGAAATRDIIVPIRELGTMRKGLQCSD